MPKKVVYNILTKAFLDGGFRRELLTDLKGALSKLGESLTPEEEQEIKQALDESGDSSATGLDQRLSKSGVSLNPQALFQQRSRTEDKHFTVADTAGELHGKGKLQTQGREESSFRSESNQNEKAADTATEPFDEDEADFEMETD